MRRIKRGLLNFGFSKPFSHISNDEMIAGLLNKKTFQMPPLYTSNNNFVLVGTIPNVCISSNCIHLEYIPSPHAYNKYRTTQVQTAEALLQSWPLCVLD